MKSQFLSIAILSAILTNLNSEAFAHENAFSYTSRSESGNFKSSQTLGADNCNNVSVHPLQTSSQSTEPRELSYSPNATSLSARDISVNQPLNCAPHEKHELVLYYTTYCPYSQKVLKYLQKIHKRLPMKNLQEDPLAKEELKAIGGKMQVPCLVIDGHALYESDAIIEWLSQHQDELESD